MEMTRNQRILIFVLHDTKNRLKHAYIAQNSKMEIINKKRYMEMIAAWIENYICYYKKIDKRICSENAAKKQCLNR